MRKHHLSGKVEVIITLNHITIYLCDCAWQSHACRLSLWALCPQGLCLSLSVVSLFIGEIWAQSLMNNHITGVSWVRAMASSNLKCSLFFITEIHIYFWDPLISTVCSLKPCFSLSFFKAFTINLLSLLASQTVDLFINSFVCTFSVYQIPRWPTTFGKMCSVSQNTVR